MSSNSRKLLGILGALAVMALGMPAVAAYMPPGVAAGLAGMVAYLLHTVNADAALPPAAGPDADK